MKLWGTRNIYLFITYIYLDRERGALTKNNKKANIKNLETWERCLRNNLIMNIPYYPTFQNVRDIMEKLDILLTLKKEHQKIIPNVPVAEFQIGNSLNITCLEKNDLKLRRV